MFDHRRMPMMGDFAAPQVNARAGEPTFAPGGPQREAPGGASGGLGLGSFLNVGDIEELLTRYGSSETRSDEELLRSMLQRANAPSWGRVRDNDPAITQMIRYAARIPNSGITANIRETDRAGWRAKLDKFVGSHFSSGGDTGHRDPPTYIALLFIMSGEAVPENLASKSSAELAILLLQRMNLEVPDWLRPETDRSYLVGEMEDGSLYQGEATTENKGVLQVVYTPGGMPEVDYRADTANMQGAIAVHTVHNPDNELIRALADLNVFHTVVISAHGNEEGILACDSTGMAREMLPDEIAACIADSSIENVVLAACHGETQGDDLTFNIFGSEITIPDFTVAQTLSLYGFNVAAFKGPVLETEVNTFLAACASSGAFTERGSDFMRVARQIDREDDNLGIRTRGQGELPDVIRAEVEKLRDRVSELMDAGALDEQVDQVMDEFDRVGVGPPRPPRDTGYVEGPNGQRYML